MKNFLENPDGVRAMADAAINALNAHICIIATDGTIITVNKAWRIFAEANGMDAAAVSEGTNYLRVCDTAKGDGAEDAAVFAAGTRSLASGVQNEFVHEYDCHAPTQKRWFIARVTRLQWQNETLLVISHENISQRKLVEEALHTSQFMLSEAERLAHTGAWDLDFAAGVGTYSNGWGKIHGTEKLTMTLDEMFALVHPDDWDAVRKKVERVHEKHTRFDSEFRIIRADTGEERIVRAVGDFSPATSGGHDRAIGVSIDITERKRHEREREAYLKQLRALSDNLQRAREDERAWVAREIHDEFGQSLTRLAFEVSLLKRKIGTEERSVYAACESIEKMIGQLITSVQQIATQLRPALLDEFGLIEALLWQLKDFQSHSSIGCSFTIIEDIPEISPGKATAIFRILQEALTNILRHAEATRASVRFYPDSDDLVLEVEDDGVGMSEEAQNAASSIGIIGMKERARACGGTATITSEPGKFTLVTVRMPITQGTKMNDENDDENSDR